MIPIPIPNANFDSGFYNWGDIGELCVATNWVPWWSEGDQPGYNHRPEYAPERMRFQGQKLFTTFATHRAGLYQRVALPTGVRSLRFLVDCQYWSQHTDGSGGGLAMRCGIDPSAGTDPYATGITWGEWHGQDDRPAWDGKTTKTLIAEDALDGDQGPWVTLWIESRCRYPAKHNDAYFDAAQLLGEVEEEPGPQPSDLLEILRSIDGHLARIADSL